MKLVKVCDSVGIIEFQKNFSSIGDSELMSMEFFFHPESEQIQLKYSIRFNPNTDNHFQRMLHIEMYHVRSYKFQYSLIGVDVLHIDHINIGQHNDEFMFDFDPYQELQFKDMCFEDLHQSQSFAICKEFAWDLV